MKVYNTTRYKITDELRKAIREHSFSMRKMSRILGFEVKNIYRTNISIRADHLERLKFLLDIDLNLEKIEFDFTKNLGTNAFVHPIKPIQLNEDLAEFIGIMLGDGNIWKNQLKISLDRRNEYYIKYVEELAKKIFDIKLRIKFEKNNNEANLYYYNKSLIEQLLQLGLKRGNKIKNQVGIPQWIKQDPNYVGRCVRGLIDTDGCIYTCKREKQTYIKFTNYNQQLLNDFKEVTMNIGYCFAKANKRNICLYRKLEVEKFFKDIKPIKSMGV